MNISTPTISEPADAFHPLFADAPGSVEFNKLRKRLLRNMRQAIETGNRLVMMDAGRVRDDIHGAGKTSLTPADLVDKFKIENDRMLLGS